MHALRKVFLLSIVSVSGMMMVSCDKDNDTATRTSFQLEMTDAPVDDPQVEAVIITVADIKLDGESLDGYQGKQTFDLKAYHSGNTKLLFDGQIDAGTYNTLTLVIDGAVDASGGEPGSYIRLASGESIAMAEGLVDLDITSNLVIAEEETERYVVDLDLRKVIQHNSMGETDYAWTSEAEIEAGLRLVNYNQSGMIAGMCTDLLTQSDKIIVYAYTSGSFSDNTELAGPQGENFPNAVTSAAVDVQGQYTLSFLPAGEYELHFASLRDLNMDDQLELTGMLSVNPILGPGLTGITVNASSQVEINVEVTGLLPL